jgi:hypothetical protein
MGGFFIDPVREEAMAMVPRVKSFYFQFRVQP